MIMCDTKGVIYKGRVEGMNPYKALFAADTPSAPWKRQLKGLTYCSAFLESAFTADMVRSMAPNPIIFAMANPDGDHPGWTRAARGDVIIATGRSDYPNQVNNVPTSRSSSAEPWMYGPAASMKR